MDIPPTPARFLRREHMAEASGPVVVIDVIRAFTTAACALARGATSIHLVAEVEQATAFKRARPGVLAVGEILGRRVPEFDFANSPWELSQADVAGRELVLRTTAGTQGVVAADGAARLWCGSLTVATATAAELAEFGGDPAYVLTGTWSDDPESGMDDLTAAQFIEAQRLRILVHGAPAGWDAEVLAAAAADAATASAEVRRSAEAARTLALAPDHAAPEDVDLAVDVDRFDFAMPVRRESGDRWIEGLNS